MADEDVDYDAAAQAENLPLYIFMLMYFLTICVVGFVAKRWKEAAMKKGEVQAHFSGDFPVGLIMLTTFSSVFSGYTVIGVPTEARAQGFYAVRWMPAIFSIAIACAVFFPRLRRLANVRGYNSPTDFLADRYRSKLLTVLGSVSTCGPQLFYLTVQLVSFAGLLNGLTSGAISNNAGMVLFAVMVLALERIGGMNSVVLSDAVQALLMVFGFIAVFISISVKYGSLAALSSADCPSYGLANTSAKELFELPPQQLDTYPPDCAAGLESNPDCTAYGCIPAAAFSSSGKPAFFWFIFNFIAFPLNPHMVQRATIASSDNAIKTTVVSLTWASYLTMLPGIAVGITAATFSSSWPLSSSEAGALAAIQNELKKEGPLMYALVAMLTCSALAAIMSTADSVILGVSNALSIDIYKGVLKRNASPANVVSVGNWISIVFTGMALIAGLFISSGEFGLLLSLQNGLILQIVPAFFLGLFYEGASRRAIQIGLICALILLPILQFVYNPVGSLAPAPNACAIINFAVTGVLHLVGVQDDDAPEDDTDDFQSQAKVRFGDRLTFANIKGYMAWDIEPNVLLLVTSFVVSMIGFPWVWDIEETELLPWIGFPMWALYVLGLSVLASCFLTASLIAWRPSEPEKKNERSDEMQLSTSFDHTRPSGLL